ncbi:MAG TPA: Rap1a/Tai family immunity protein [Rhodospirillales bacterium]
MEVNSGEFRQARRALVAALVLSAALTAAAWAAEPAQGAPPIAQKGHWTTGERLYGYCLSEVKGMAENPLCVGFVSAVADVLADNAAVSGYRACLRGDLTLQHLVVAVKEFLKARRDLVKLPAVTLVARALAHEFPCK